jgi:hypothetical protein
MTSPNNTQSLNLSLQSLKQSLEALAAIGKLEDLPSFDLLPAQAKAVQKHANKIVEAEVSISKLLKLAIQNSDIPVQRASSSLLKYYREHFLPHKDLILRLSDPIMAEF